MGLQPIDWFRWEGLHHYRDPRFYNFDCPQNDSPLHLQRVCAGNSPSG